TAQPPENHLAPGVDLAPFGQGMGALGLPGDASPASRYVRAAFSKLNSPDQGDELTRVTQFFHLLDTVAMVRGTVLTPEGKHDLTTYSCCCAGGTYYYKTYGNSRITAVRMAGTDLESDQPMAFPLREAQDVAFEN